MVAQNTLKVHLNWRVFKSLDGLKDALTAVHEKNLSSVSHAAE